MILLFPAAVHAACGGDLESHPFRVRLESEVPARVRIMPVGDEPLPLARYDFNFAGETWSAELTGQEVRIIRGSEALYVLLLEEPQDGFFSAQFVAQGDHGSLTLESGAKVHVFSIDRAGTD